MRYSRTPKSIRVLVIFLLYGGISPIRADPPGQIYPALLFEAVRWNDVSKAKALVVQGADVNGRNKEGSTPLIEAVFWDCPDMVRWLLDNGANVHMPDENYGWTALMWAAYRGHPVIARMLLEKKAQVNVRTRRGDTPLIIAAQYGYTEVARLLLAHGTDIHVNQMSRGALAWAARNGHPAIVEALLDRGARVNGRDYWGKPPLFEAVREGHLDVVKCLLARGAKVNLTEPDGTFVLMEAASRGYREIVQALLAQGAKVNATTQEGETALMRVVSAPHRVSLSPEESRLDMIFGSPRSKVDGETYHKIAELLLAYGAKVNARDQQQRTALIYATRSGHRELVALLLAHRADHRAKDAQGKTAWTYAADEGYQDIVALLQQSGVKEGGRRKGE